MHWTQICCQNPETVFCAIEFNCQVLKKWQCQKCTELELELIAKPVLFFVKIWGLKRKFFTLLQLEIIYELENSPGLKRKFFTLLQLEIADISQSPKELYNLKIHWLKVNFGFTYKIRLNFESVHNIVLYSILWLHWNLLIVLNCLIFFKFICLYCQTPG